MGCLGEYSAHKRAVHVWGLPRPVDGPMLRDFMSPAGNIELGYVIFDSQGRHRGCGYVRYGNEHIAVCAAGTLHGQSIRDTDGNEKKIQVKLWSAPALQRASTARSSPESCDEKSAQSQSSQQ